MIKAHHAMMLSLAIASMMNGVTAPKPKNVQTSSISSEEAAPTSTSSTFEISSTAEILESPTSTSSAGMTAETSAVTRSTTYPECFLVVRIWQLMGGSTTVSSTSSTACCFYLGSTYQTSGIPGVSCTTDGKVTGIQWERGIVGGSIPSEIGNLVNLQYL
jgi:hypothetical protein